MSDEAMMITQFPGSVEARRESLCEDAASAVAGDARAARGARASKSARYAEMKRSAMSAMCLE